MPFYTDVKSRKKKVEYKFTTVDKERATKLFKTLRHDRMIVRRPNLNRWAHFFHLLSIEIQNDSKIDRVLDWFCKNSKNKYTPKVHSADAFLNKFGQIKMVMGRHEETKSPIKDRTKKFIKEYRLSFDWPKEYKKNFRRAVQQSLDNAHQLKRLLKSILKKLKRKANKNPERHYSRYEVIKYLNDQYFCNPDQFVADWFKSNFDRLSQWQEWTGNPMHLVLSWDRKQFRRTCLDLIQCPEREVDAFIQAIRDEAVK